MSRRRSRYLKPSATGLTGLRERLAQEAARLIVEHGIADYGHAKRKAAERLGVSEFGALPSNAHIEASVAERQRIFAPSAHDDRLAQLRELAADVMERLALFRPRLVGAVLNGTATINSAVELHVFSDTPEAVEAVLRQHGHNVQDTQRRLRFTAGQEPALVPGFRFSADGEQVIALVFPEHGVRQAPLSPVDRKPMRRAARAEVLALLG
jgi:hypothetical protein